MTSSRHRERAALRANLRFAAATAATSWAAMWSWRGFTDNSVRFLLALVLVAAVVALTGAVARWRRLPGLLVVLAQGSLGTVVLCLQVAGTPYPGSELREVMRAAIDAANTYASPVPSTSTVDVQPVLILGGLVAIVLVDLCACSLRRVPLAGLPLLTVYSVPVSLLGTGLSWWVFAATAGGFLLMLFFQEEEHLSRWGRSLDGSGEPARRLSDSVRASALVVGSVATAAAVLLPLAIPTFDFSVFDVGAGRGGEGDIDITNPMLDLRRDLERGEDIDLVRIRTDDPNPDHLRISVLNRFTDNEWSAGDRSVPTANLANGDLPPLDGVEERIATVAATYDYEVEVLDELDSRWLPTQAPIGAIDAAGDWRFDDRTMDFLASDDDLSTAGLSYSMTAVDLDYDTEQLLRLDSSPIGVADELTELPDGFPGEVERLADVITATADTDFEAAVLLQQWFHAPGNFTYDDTPATSEIGTDELVEFLAPGNRTGYCEQFAASMAVMARYLGIPARVAVGFLKPSPDPDDPAVQVYSAHDLHAWVELYFPGAGWVLFDPTPSRISERLLRDYSTTRIAEPVIPTTQPTAPDRSEGPDRPSSSAAAPTNAPDEEQAAATDDTPAESGFAWVWFAGALLVLALIALGVRLPRGVRERQRARRLAGGVEAAWAELRATAVDLRRTWPEGRSPRETADVVTGWFGRTGDDDERPARGRDVAPEAAAALDRIVGEVERARYSRRRRPSPPSLGDDALLCCEALAAGATPRTRRRARWLPASVTQRRTVENDLGLPSDAVGGDEGELVGARVEHI